MDPAVPLSSRVGASVTFPHLHFNDSQISPNLGSAIIFAMASSVSRSIRYSAHLFFNVTRDPYCFPFFPVPGGSAVSHPAVPYRGILMLPSSVINFSLATATGNVPGQLAPRKQVKNPNPENSVLPGQRISPQSVAIFLLHRAADNSFLNRPLLYITPMNYELRDARKLPRVRDDQDAPPQRG